MRALDWPERLAAAVAAAQRTPFAWGTHDCACWAGAVIAALTGVDPWAAYRGTYQSAAGARQACQTLGPDLAAAAAALCARHGWAAIPPACAQRGDLVLAPSGLLAWPDALGICLGTTLAALGPQGLLRIRRDAATAAWRIG